MPIIDPRCGIDVAATLGGVTMPAANIVSAWCARMLAACACAALVVLAPCARAATPAAGAAVPHAAAAKAPELPAELTPESIRDALSKMSDQQVRSLLIEQLDRAAKSSGAVQASDGMMARAGMAGMMESSAVTLRGRLQDIAAAARSLPATVGDVVDRLDHGAGEGSGIARLAGAFALMLLAGLVVEGLYSLALRGLRRRLAQPADATWFARAFGLGASFALDAGAIVVFAAGALGAYFGTRAIPELWRIVLVSALIAVVVVRSAALVARFLLGRAQDNSRLLPLDDRTSRRFRLYVLVVSVLFGINMVVLSVMGAADIDESAQDVVRIGAWSLGIVITLVLVGLVRRPIAALIRGAETRHASVRGGLADLWPLIAIAYFFALYAASIHGMLMGRPGPLGIGLASLLVVVFVPIVDYALCSALAAGVAANATDGSPRAPGWFATYEPIFRRAIHIVTIVGGILILADWWDLRLFAYAQKGLGGEIASSILGIGIVLLATYLAWQIATTAIDNRMRAEGDVSKDMPSSRLRTVLPILRATILITIATMATMSILAAMGVDILPLLAGASIVGVAIGFGSQTLVRDIVSGAFFLMDDAFRLGEYIEVGSAKGNVEKISVRSVFLRHQRGALFVVPYGQIHQLRNASRDWQVLTLEFRLTYDTNLLQVKKIMKKIGEELAADPDYAPDIISPLKSAGVMSAEDSAIVVRAKFTSRPTGNAWVVRRVAYDKVIRAFRDAGIRFAHRQVTVNVAGGGAGGGDAAAGGAAAAAVIAEAERSAKAG
jgi:small-conductance mechanosensitive channel